LLLLRRWIPSWTGKRQEWCGMTYTSKPLRRAPAMPYPESAPLSIRTLLLCACAGIVLWLVVLFVAFQIGRAIVEFVQRVIGVN
jgi:hypothetical protein